MTSSVLQEAMTDLIRDALALGASDLHLTLSESRARVNGALHAMPRRWHESLDERLALEWKRFLGFNLADTSSAQDTSLSLPECGVDVRANLTTTRRGPKIVLRFLQRDKQFSLSQCGLCVEAEAALRSALAKKGLILITGETGSGKSTLLYSALASLDRQTLNIHTIEDPVEYTIDGITQSQVNTRRGQTFASYLRGLMRQDPDVILIGEIRDQETAQAAIHAANTGHTVLSTLHANSTALVPSRIAQLGVSDSDLADVLTFWSTQELVPLVCRRCSAQEGPSGCPACAGTGVSGRKLVLEYATKECPVTSDTLENQKSRLASQGLIHDRRQN